MIKILFICHGNICRSPMAEFVMKELVKKEGLEKQFEIASAATSTEEIWGGIGNPVYPPVAKLLNKKGIDTSHKRARQVTQEDYNHYDMLICMDRNNMRNIKYIIPDDPQHKITMLLDRDVADPWYTRDFQTTYDDILKGCQALLARLL